MSRFLFLLLVSCFASFAQTAPRPWHETLTQIRKNVALQILRADNYICVQDLVRTYYTTATSTTPCEQPPHVPDMQPALKDRLRMDVAVSEGNEIYAWHGEKTFSSKGVMDLVQHGPVSSGGFTGYLRNIFVSAGIEFTYRKPTSAGGQTTYHFDYHVPEKVSRYQIKAGDQMVIIPFHGSFTARADTLELETLVVTADSGAIPPNAELCFIQATVTYKIAHISSTDSLIPSAFDILYGSSRGRTITESHGEFSQCRQYLGESTVRFDAEEPAGAADKVVSVEAASIKPGIVLRIALATPIDSDTAYAGMHVEGALAHPAKIGNGVVLPAGTAVEGLITRFETYFEPEPHTLMVIEFNHLNAGNKSYLFRALHPHDLYQQMQLTPGMRSSGRRMGTSRQIYTPTSDDEPGVLTFSKSKVYLDKKFVSEYEVVSSK